MLLLVVVVMLVVVTVVFVVSSLLVWWRRLSPIVPPLPRPNANLNHVQDVCFPGQPTVTPDHNVD